MRKKNVIQLIRITALCLVVIYAHICRLCYPDVWLFFSRPDEKDGNAYALYQWAKSRRKCYFVQDKKSPVFEKGMIPYHSLKHFLVSALAKVHVFDIGASGDVYGRRLRKAFGLQTKYVFLQHGVMMGDIPMYHYERTGYDLMIASSAREYRFLHETFHYPENRLALTGMARFDDLLRNVSDKGYILIMPTWRKELKAMSREEFLRSEFFIRYQSLLNDPAFIEFLKRYNLKLRFFLHYMIRDKQEMFSFPADVCVYDETASVHGLLRGCSLLITDYSSVAFDAAMAGKAIIYYQFQDYSYQSAQNYFRFETDGFGAVVKTQETLVSTVRNLWNGKAFERPEFYTDRCNSFFAFQDTNHCQRICDSIEAVASQRRG